MQAKRTFIMIKAERGNTEQQIEFPEEDTDLNRLRWWIVNIVAPVKVSWFE